MSQRFPNFFVLGVQKCGTTTIADVINSHPAAFIPSIKETYFFCLEANYRKGTDAYWAEFFSPVRAGHLAVGEATPFYLCSQTALDRIAAATRGVRRISKCSAAPARRRRIAAASWIACDSTPRSAQDSNHSRAAS